jgi:hypothetical protein
MSDFPDLGRRVLQAQITDKLGARAPLYDMTALVNAYVKEFGFYDVAEVDPARFRALLKEHLIWS